MISDFFKTKKPNNLVYSRAKARSLARTKQSTGDDTVEYDMEGWNADSTDALRIPILTAELTDKSNRQRLADSLASKVVDSDSVPVLIPEGKSHSVVPLLKNVVKKRENTARHGLVKADTKVVGIYSDSPSYMDQLIRRLSKESPYLKLVCFSATDLKENIKKRESAEAWVINLSEEGDHPFLDSFIDSVADIATLFLFERAATAKCVDKILQFVEESGLKQANH